MGSKRERLASAPAEAHNCNFAVSGRNALSVVGSRVEVFEDNGRIKPGDCFYGCVLTGEFTRPAAIGTEAGEQIWGNHDKAFRSQFVGHLLRPIGKAKDLVDEDDDRRLFFYFGIHDERLQRARVVLERDIFMMTRGSRS